MMATFALVHGAWHGAWCWKYLALELEQQKHKVITMDLPIEDANATVMDYAKTVADALKGEKDIYLVGHSMAGMVIPLVADLIPMRKLIYLCAVLRRPGYSLAQDNAEGLNIELNPPGFDKAYKDEGNGFSSLTKEAIPFFYADCKPEVISWAFSNLRKQHTYWTDVSPQQEWPKVACTSIICEEDRAISPIWSKRVAREWLKTTPILLLGSHSPFFSRPKQLADILLSIAAKDQF